MMDQTPSAPTTLAGPAPRGFWRESCGRYVLGSLAATVVESLVLLVVVWPASAGWGGGVLLALMLLGTGVALVLVPLASWAAWHLTAPGLVAPLRWLSLTAIASLVSLTVLLLLLSAFRVTELWFWCMAPIVGLHVWWTALFLLGRYR